MTAAGPTAFGSKGAAKSGDAGSRSRELFIRAGTLIGLASLVFAWLFWISAYRPEVRFLPPARLGKWIVYPQPMDARVVPLVTVTGRFERKFVLLDVPRPAVLTWLAFTQCVWKINGQETRPANAPTNWKCPSTVDITRFLQVGTNEISATVSNQFAPPALCACIRGGEYLLGTDQSWESSLAGAQVQPARLVSSPALADRGNPLFGVETLLEAWRAVGRWAVLFAATTAALGGCIWGRRRLSPSFLTTNWVLAICALAWLALFLHNLRYLPVDSGFDVEEHLKYINFIQTRKCLPLANEGWEMYQPPLYYLLSAGWLGLLHRTISEEGGILALRLLGLGIGLAHALLILRCLRLLFPGDKRKPIIGALFGGVVPAHLYLLHYVTNETLAATLVTASLYCALKELEAEGPTRCYPFLAGLCLGAAMLTKVSAVLVTPFIFAALGVKLLFPRSRSLSPRHAIEAGVKPEPPDRSSHKRRIWPQNTVLGLGLFLIAMLGTCGWFYWRTWKNFGSPLVGNWNPALGRSWWQLPGCHAGDYYIHFGQVFFHPFFSGLQSFWDGFYSTLWGDGLCGGRISLNSRPPWNYNLMVLSYWLALIPTVVLLTGCWRMIANWLQHPSLKWFMLGGLLFASFFSIIYMSLKIPSYAQVKAFYGLCALPGFCAIATLGYGYLCERGQFLRRFLQVMLFIWVASVIASFWIVGQSAQTRLALGISRQVAGKNLEAEKDFDAALRMDPGNVDAAVRKAILLEAKGACEESARQLQELIRQHPENAPARVQLAYQLLGHGDGAQAIACLREAVRLAPENSDAWELLCGALLQAGKVEEGIAAARGALRLAPAIPSTHFNLGFALLRTQARGEAISHFFYALELSPRLAPAHYYLGCALLAEGRKEEGLDHIKEAVRLAPEKEEWRRRLEAGH